MTAQSLNGYPTKILLKVLLGEEVPRQAPRVCPYGKTDDEALVPTSKCSCERTINQNPCQRNVMYDLKCRREGCQFNQNCCCTAKKITVGKTANCQSYVPSEDYHKKEKSKLKQRALRCTTMVDCKATGCIFNTAGKCIANGITVETLDNNEPECCTIKLK